MPHQQQNELVQTERESESESSPPSPLPLSLPSHTSPTTTHTICNICTSSNHKPHHSLLCRRTRKSNSFSDASHRTWDRLKKLCTSYLPHMDLHCDSPLHPPPEVKKKSYSGLKEREELEREVTVLHKLLHYEQKVHEYLEKLHHRQDGSTLSIPNFLPPKMKEILAELAMVENEVARLEGQIKYIKDEMKQAKEANIERKYREWGRKALPPHPNTNAERTNEKAHFESKALHFINKAIKGDYRLPNFALSDKSINQNASHEGGGGSCEKLSKRSGLLKHPSPLREARNRTPRRDRSLDVGAEYQARVLSTPLHTEEESISKWTPNKLSENIMKCLVFVYVRLLRTSRAMELEKSGPMAHSPNFSLSFRADTASNAKTSLQKESRQQDLYTIFYSEVSMVRDIGPYKNLVRFASNSMDMKCIQNSSSVPLFQKLKVLMDGLQKVDLRFLSHQQKLAFWINMYNACIMHGYLKYGVPTILNHESLQALMKKATLIIAGNKINARAIEHFILRNSQDSSSKDKNSREMIVGELYGLKTPDPNIIFALCCGTRSSPAVKIYTAEGVVAELERSKLEYLQAAIVVSNMKKVALPELLLANMKDFAAEKEALIEWVYQQLPTAGSLRKSIVDCFRSVNGGKASAVVEKIPYEFEFQYLLDIRN